LSASGNQDSISEAGFDSVMIKATLSVLYFFRTLDIYERFQQNAIVVHYMSIVLNPIYAADVSIGNSLSLSPETEGVSEMLYLLPK